MARRGRTWRIVAAVIFIAALVGVAVWPTSVPVNVAPIQRGTMQVTVDEEGETRLRDRFAVSAPVAGRVLRIELEPGDPVKRGEAVARILPAPPQPLDARARAEAQAAVEASAAAVRRTRAERERAAAALKLAQSELARQRELFKESLVSRQMLEAQETAARTAEETLSAAEFAVAAVTHEHEMARSRLIGSDANEQGGQPVVIRSPVDGVVLRRLRQSESIVIPGEPLVELGDPARLEIVADLLSTDAVQVKPGQRVTLDQWGGSQPLEAVVRRIEPSGFMKISALGVEEQRVNVIIDFVDRAKAVSLLGDAYRVEVRIVVWEATDVLKAPTSSLFRRGNQWMVFVIDGNRARTREVEIGRRNGTEAQVVKGLQAGDRVVVHPSDDLTEGARIMLRRS